MKTIVDNNREVLLDPVGTRVVCFLLKPLRLFFYLRFGYLVEWMDHPRI